MIPLPNKKYRCILADPPWKYGFKSPTGSPRPKSSQEAGGVNYYYNVMNTKDICNMPIPNICEKNCVLFLWATVPLLPDAFEVMNAWGFKYKTMLTWHKLRCKGMGYWFRGHTEHILFGTKGKVKAFRSLIHNIQAIDVLSHSKKPPEFYNIFEDVTIGMEPRIELFAREQREGWDVWGNQIPKTTQMILNKQSVICGA